MIIVALLLVLGWLVSLANRPSPSESVPETPTDTFATDTMATDTMATDTSSITDTAVDAAADRARVEQGLLGIWVSGDSRLTISRDDSGYVAVYRFPDPPPFSRGEAHQTMRGELLPTNELKLTNIYQGKLANPLDYFSGAFDGESSVVLSADGMYVTARLHDGRSMVLTRDTDSAQAAAPSEDEEPSVAPVDSKIAEMQTTAGEIVIRFFPDKAPNHVKNFIALAESGFYDGTNFHRVIPGFMIQGGDPFTKSGPTSKWGTGGAAVTLDAEFNDVHHRRGIVSMARAQGRNTASSQFFICVDEAGFLDGQYTVFGEVIRGMDVVDTIVHAERGPRDQPRSPTRVLRVTIRNATGDESRVGADTNSGGDRDADAQQGSAQRAAPSRAGSSSADRRVVGLGAQSEPPPAYGNESVHTGEFHPASVLTRTEPRYTEVARKARISGVVVLECVIDRYGDVRRIRVLKGLPFGLDKAAADAVATWKFRPGTIDGQPVETVFNLTVNFTLDR